MSDSPLTNREVHLMFENIKESIKAVRDDIKVNNQYAEKRFKLIEEEIKEIKAEIEDLKTFKTRTLAYWTLTITAVTFAVNKFL